MGCHPKRIGPYQIIGVIGRGGMGTVYRAVLPQTDKAVALKLLNPSEPLLETLGMDTLRELFTVEAAIMAELAHPNIARVLDSGEERGRHYFTMDYRCANLGMLIGESYLVDESCRRVPPDLTLACGSQILAGLQGMHSAGIVHRDIKPYNMLLAEDGSIQISDFGMARKITGKPFPARGMQVGSPYYTAPEQRRDPNGADGRADLYSAGVLLYRMLTGELPAMKGFMLSQVNPLYDENWDAFFAKALRWQPRERFQSGEEMRQALLQLQPRWNRVPPPASISGTGAKTPLRSSPLRLSGNRARKEFGVDRLWQPLATNSRLLIPRDAYTLLDKATGLVWQGGPSCEPTDWEGSRQQIAALNDTRFAGIDTWRLPTVNELLSLSRNPSLPPTDDPCPPAGPGACFWSCDRRSPTTSWYVNISLGFAGWQNTDCQFAVRAVAVP